MLPVRFARISLPCIPKEIQIFEFDGKKICQDTICENTPSEDGRVAYFIIREALKFFDQNFGICGIDRKGTVPKIFINWSEKNAASICNQIGSADDCFLRFHNEFLTPSAIVHEYTHALIARLSPLDKCGQPGALNEAISDVMGIAFTHALLDRRFYNINKSWVVQPVQRDFSKHIDMESYKCFRICTWNNDYGYVHANSRIPSHAFFVAVVNSQTQSYGVMSRIWFEAMLISNPNETFGGFALKTLAIAEKSFPQMKCHLIRSWIDVKILKLKILRYPSYSQDQQERYRRSRLICWDYAER